MRTSPAKLLILIALIFVIVIELRTVLAFFDIETSILEAAVVSIVATLIVIAWAFTPSSTNADQ
ncbi:CbaC protein (plasmid) [Natrialba magadii ATCC 43099]|uniref:CbaC protein n=1 Tax=Natrialba magadii (strain ATCC 43099 / DSM 3394 / CCM 3739 / CIP 104546 / IAM 13178 / JCM 8861 / NBRC 102185 / NCIMB 2190 / MS3) TaxID=547559 RepID=D3T186_NATMM|nr:hypothetical protein [Natrialba magadii]ADD07345.1 CbaC protein [Natrialba magadii ATCC 43099]ELY32601.1 CbaC protein [Natrialba magadii ATCC 43099]